MFEMPDMSRLMRRKSNGSMTKGILWFALGAAVGLGVSRMRNQTHSKQMSDDASGPMEVDI